MKLYNLFLILLIVCGSATASGQKKNSFDSPMTKAVMNVYQKQLEADPNDYETYFRRANEYYRHNIYDKALSDIDNAIRYTPASQKDLRFQELTLRANIYTMQKRYTEALADLSDALQLDPTSYVTVYQKANIDFELGDYTQAKAGYNRLKRLNNRSQEALFGLARVAVKENNIGLANDYIEQAVALNPSDADAYVRRAYVYQLMGNTSASVDDLILAISTDHKNTKALHELVKLSNTDYSTVISGLSNAIRQAPRVGMFYYIRATIAKAHHRYPAAISDYTKIIDERLYDYGGLYGSRSECHYALGMFNEALYDIDYAIGSTRYNRDHYIAKSAIKRALNAPTGALDAANDALKKDAESTDALVAKALVSFDAGNYQEASDLIGQATMTEVKKPYYFMLRGWICDKYLNQPDAAQSSYLRVLDIDFPQDNVMSLRGFALLKLGRTAEARQWIESILAKEDSDGRLNYYGACFYAQAGEPDKALACMQKALEQGYANIFDWKFNNDADINVAPIRQDPRFESLLTQYAGIFQL